MGLVEIGLFRGTTSAYPMDATQQILAILN